MKLRALPGVLTLVSGLLAWTAVALPTGPAAAEVIMGAQDDAPQPAQHFEVAADVVVPEPQRDDWGVTMVSVIQWPTTGPTPYDYSDGFGWRVSPTAGASSDHKGVDLTPGGGTDVEVIADGTVTQAGPNGGLGQAVTVEHILDGQSVTTVYGHMQYGSIRVEPGQHVERGTVLGLVGSTGISTGNHLHFEVHLGGVPVDPYAWLQAHANAHLWE